jgi:hypothetical protein
MDLSVVIFKRKTDRYCQSVKGSRPIAQRLIGLA